MDMIAATQVRQITSNEMIYLWMLQILKGEG